MNILFSLHYMSNGNRKSRAIAGYSTHIDQWGNQSRGLLPDDCSCPRNPRRRLQRLVHENRIHFRDCHPKQNSAILISTSYIYLHFKWLHPSYVPASSNPVWFPRGRRTMKPTPSSSGSRTLPPRNLHFFRLLGMIGHGNKKKL